MSTMTLFQGLRLIYYITPCRSEVLTSFTGVLDELSDEVVVDRDAEVAQHELQLGGRHVAVAVAVEQPERRAQIWNDTLILSTWSFLLWTSDGLVAERLYSSGLPAVIYEKRGTWDVAR